jgi:class 3 adenylate cyclase/tetratricopeptide (TPR) repeat protein
VADAARGDTYAKGMAVNCPSCGFANTAAARFCGGCGKTLEAIGSTAPEAERRHVCVLFCDLVGSTQLSHRLDAEQLRDVVGSYQRTCDAVVLRHGGFVAQYRGDSIEVYFGYPHAHEDDVSRAVRCALDLLVAVRQLGAVTKLDLEVRVGIDCGRVVVGTLGHSRPERLAVGETPNVAARVQGEAAPGEVVVSDSLWRLLPGTFAAEPMGTRNLKGIARPVGLFKVVASGGQAARPHAPRTPFIGRTKELGALEALWMSVEQGAARFVVLRGEPGIGKSRLVEEFRRRVAAPDIDVLDARCTAYAQHSAFLPVTELIASRLGLDRSLGADEKLDRIDRRLAELRVSASDAAPLLAALLSIPTGERYPPLVMSPIRRRVRTLEILAAALKATASQRRMMFIVEDLHWADPSTLELLQLIISQEPRLPLLGILTARPEFQPAWPISGPTSLIDVSRLDSAEVEAVVSSIARGKLIPGEVMRGLTQRCEGVPLFAEEVTRAVMESGAIEEREFSWELTGPLPTELIPASIDASLMARIDRLGEARATAQLAATIGREFSYALLRAVSERSEAALGDDLQRIVDAGLAWQTPTGDAETYVFKHVLVQVAAYELLLHAERQRHHEAIARVLLSDFRVDVEHQPEIVARHLSGAGHHAEACDYWLSAGQNALNRMAIPEAHGHFARALDGLKQLLRQAPESPEILTKELELQIAIAPTLMTLHGWASPAVAEACERARALCQRLDRPDRLYPPVWGLWTNLFVGGLLDRALVTANEALAMAVGSGVPMLEVTGRHAVAYTHYYRGEWSEAIPHAEAGLALYSVEQERALTSTFQLSSTVNLVAVLGSSLWMMGHQTRALEELDRMIAIAREVNHPSALSNALGVACYMLTFHQDFPRMLGCAEEVKSFAREEGWELWYAVGVMSSGWARLRMGDCADGLKELFEGVALFRATRSDLMGPTVGIIHGEGLRAAGRKQEAIEMLGATAQTAERGHVGVLLPDVYRLMGEIHLEAGAFSEAESAYRKALDTATAQQALSLALRAALSYHTLLERTGRCPEGHALVHRHYERFTDSFAQPDLLRARAMLEAVH